MLAMSGQWVASIGCGNAAVLGLLGATTEVLSVRDIRPGPVEGWGEREGVLGISPPGSAESRRIQPARHGISRERSHVERDF